MDTVRPITRHEQVLIESSSGIQTRADITSVTQRNFSRVAIGRDPGGRRLFLKQFVGRDGAARRGVYDDEGHGFEVAQHCWAGHLKLPRVVGCCEDRLITCYEHLEFMPIETLLRRDPRALASRWPALVDKLADAVETTADAAAAGRCRGLRTKERPYSSHRPAVNFKGFEVRNVAILPSPPGEPPRLAAFDVGRPYLAPIEEVAARVLVSTLLLNWGFPVTRFVKGPPTGLADTLAARLEPLLHPAAIGGELEREARAKRTVARFGAAWLRVPKTLGVATIGSWYLSRSRRWCRDNGLA